MERRAFLVGLVACAMGGSAVTDAAAQPPPWAGGGRRDWDGRGRDWDERPGRRRGWRGDDFPPGRAVGLRRRIACQQQAEYRGLFGWRARNFINACMRGF